MVYKNFFLRLIFTLIFLTIYFTLSYINFEYVYYLIFIIYLVIIFEILLFFKKYKIIPVIYVIISFLFFLNINFNNNIYIFFNLFIMIVITFDIFSYLSGKLFGKNKLINISPNKTVEGFIGGFLVSLLISIFFLYFIKIKINPSLIIFIILSILFAFCGDIIESFFKRKNNLKNSSLLIPGHGGVFDRFDSFLFSIIFYSLSTNILL